MDAPLPIDKLADALKQHGLVRFLEHYEQLLPKEHLKELVLDAVGPHREMTVDEQRLINFGSDSFLGLDQDTRVQAAIMRGVGKWGTHNGASRAFSSVRAMEETEERLAAWLGTEMVLVYPSVSLANMGALPGLVSKRDVIIIDEHAHNSMQEGARIAQANGTRVITFAHSDPAKLQEALDRAQPYRLAVVAIDGVYSMTGALPPLQKLNEVCKANDAVLYVDDAHATAVLGQHGRGTVLDALGAYENVLVVGSLSKGFSCFGGFVGGPAVFKKLLKIRSNTFIFGGPVPPPYLEAIKVVCDILDSPEYDLLQTRLKRNIARLTNGARDLGLAVLGQEAPIVSILIGDEEMTLAAGHFLFEQGYYVQSVTFPAVPYHAGVLRIQINANHQIDAIEGLLTALQEMTRRFALPVQRRAAA
ncbi:MAG: pyridoxal phosphate-dependent aminotransferase family protein [Gemmataceae bacterium]